MKILKAAEETIGKRHVDVNRIHLTFWFIPEIEELRNKEERMPKILKIK